MSSEMWSFVYYALAMRDERGRQRLHSSGFTLYTRAAAVLLGIGIYRVVLSDVGAAAQHGVFRAVVEGAVHILLLVALILLLWFRCKPLIATNEGLELGSGKNMRLIPWANVLDVREEPWLRAYTRSHPRLFQVDLLDGEIFEFVGVRRAREIVVEFVKRSEGFKG